MTTSTDPRKLAEEAKERVEQRRFGVVTITAREDIVALADAVLRLVEALEGMRESVRANLFDGQEGGIVTMPVSDILDEVDESANQALASIEGDNP